MAKKRGFLGYNALLGDGSVMTSYTPTIGERMTDALRRMMFSDDRAGQRRAEKVMDVLSLTPVGAAADMYDAGREAGAGNYGTAGLMLGMAGIPGPSPKKGIRAFHGSPHSFERFDMSKIGTGEGAQAYGHGLYFAESEDVARGYQKNVKDNASIANVNNRLRDLVKIMDADSAGGYRQFKSDVGRNAAIEYDELLEKRQEIVSAPGSMYEVNINADPEQFLDWDKLLSKQPQHIQDAFKDIPQAPDIPGELAVYRLGNKKVNNPEASKKMLHAGIPGIKYLDAGSRRAGDGTRNYVVFDDRLIEIVSKYGIAGASAMLGYNLLEGMDPAQAEELKRIEGGR